MTILTLELPDRIASLVEQRAHARGMTLNQHVAEILEESASSADGNPVSQRTEAVRRMNELLDQVSGFRNDPRIPREELYERCSTDSLIAAAVRNPLEFRTVQ